MLLSVIRCYIRCRRGSITCERRRRSMTSSSRKPSFYGNHRTLGFAARGARRIDPSRSCETRDLARRIGSRCDRSASAASASGVIVLGASVWIDHMRRREPQLGGLLADDRISIHPFVIGEIVLGSISRLSSVVHVLENLPPAPVSRHEEALALTERERLHGLGVGYVDLHPLASARLAKAALWTRGKRLFAAAERLGVAYR